MMGRSTYRCGWLALAGVSMFAMASPALAQEEVEADASAKGGERDNLIIVTATKREQSIQEVPIAVTAISGETLAQRGFDQAEDLIAVAPTRLPL